MARRWLALASIAVACTVSSAIAGPAGAAGQDAVRVVAGPRPVVDAAGRYWRPAGRQIDGRRVRARRTPGVTASPQLYRDVALGVRRVSVRVPRPGLYAVTLYLLEPGSPSRRRVIRASSARGSREIAIPIGTPRRAPPAHLTLEVPVRGRRLALHLGGVHGRAVLSALEAQRLGPVGMPAPHAVWDERFDGAAGAPPDPAQWTVATNGGWGAEERQAYTDRPSNIALDGYGNLVLTARREPYMDFHGLFSSFTSGRLQTRRAFPLGRARVSASIRIPPGAGFWPSFWALGTSPPAWPASGEIDLMELVTAEVGVLHGFVHGPLPEGDDSPRVVYQGEARLNRGTPLSDEPHTYTLRTEPGVAEFLFDGRVYGSITRADIPKGSPWLVDRSYHLILALAVGGWMGGPLPSTPFPGRMVVGDVHVAL